MTSLESLAQPVDMRVTRLKRWTVADYHRMSELQILDSDERTELLDGQITLMVAKGTAHVLALRIVSQIFEDFLADKAFFVSTQDPIQLSDFSEPEPDFAIVRGSFFDFATEHPRPEQIALVVEIADSTLRSDCEIKDKLYAQSGILDYWVVDLKNRQLHIFRDPSSSGYTQHLILNEPQQISPLAFSDFVIELSSIFPDIFE